MMEKVKGNTGCTSALTVTSKLNYLFLNVSFHLVVVLYTFMLPHVRVRVCMLVYVCYRTFRQQKYRAVYEGGKV